MTTQIRAAVLMPACSSRSTGDGSHTMSLIACGILPCSSASSPIPPATSRQAPDRSSIGIAGRALHPGARRPASMPMAPGSPARSSTPACPGCRAPPTTAAPSIGGVPAPAISACWTAGCEHVLSIHAAGALTAIGAAASRRRREFDGRVTVVDSHSLSLGLGFQVLAAAEAAEAGSRRRACRPSNPRAGGFTSSPPWIH